MNPVTRPAALDELQSLGVRSLRVILTWRDVAPGPRQATMPANFDPTDPKRLRLGRVRAAARGREGPQLAGAPDDLRPRAVLGDRLEARRRHPSQPERRSRRSRPRSGASSARRSTRWAIWNEPNQPQFLRPQFAGGGKAASPRIYRELYRAGVRGLQKAGQGNDTILIGETSPRGTARVVAPLRFLRAMLCLDSKYKKIGKCGALSADGYAHHAYTTRQGPFFKPPRATTSRSACSGG